MRPLRIRTRRRRSVKSSRLFRELRLESLEARTVLDGQLAGAMVGETVCRPAEVDESPLAFQRASAQELKDYLIDQAVQQYYHQQFSDFWFLADVDFAVAAFDQAAPPPAPTALPDASETNVQIEGVDEADLVETDGRFIYVLSRGELTIVDVQQPENMQVRSRVDVAPAAYPGNVSLSYGNYDSQSMFLQGDRLSVLSSNWQGATLTVVDIADRSSPEVIEHTLLEGRIVSSRAIDSYVHLVMDKSWALPMPEYSGEVEAVPPPMIDFAMVDCFCVGWFESPSEPEEEYRQRLGAMPIESLINTEYVSGGRHLETGTYLSAEDFYLPPIENPYQGLTAVVTFDTSDNIMGPSHSVGLPGVRADEVFMNHESLYLFTQDYQWRSTETAITKLTRDASSGEILPVAEGKVAGRLLNRFSIGEHEGNLQIATTTGNRDSNNLYVLQQEGDQLRVSGSVEGFAPNEMIYSARFYGERGYVVTFRKVDPLFTFDLSDPENPQIVGELKIPGYSDYLQAIDENHLIGIGRNADEQTGLFQELQISLFDVSDPATPRVVDRHSFAGGRNTWSEANFEPHAVSYFDSHDVLAIPIHNGGRWRGDFGGVDNTPKLEGNQSVLSVFQIDIDSGIELLGEVEFEDRVRRSLRVGDVLYSISAETIRANSLKDVSIELGILDYLPEEEIVEEHDRPLGDVNNDGLFDSSDLVLIFQQGEYEDALVSNSTYEDGDWNGDGEFSSTDLVLAFQAGTYGLL